MNGPCCESVELSGICETKAMPLTDGLVALVDACDFEWLSQWHWWAYSSRGRTHYAMRQQTIGGRVVTVTMHRFILNPPLGFQVDHISRDGLDNRRANLRLANHSQNLFNHGPHAQNKSGLKGVSWNQQFKKWDAEISAYGTRHRLGRFSDKEAAGRAYDAAAREMHGEFAWLNFPEEQP